MKKIKKKKKKEHSKVLSTLVIIFGFIIAQECLFLMWYCIRLEFTPTAAWLTAAVGLAEAVIGSGLTGYLSLAKSDHKEGGITLEAAKANGFKEFIEEEENINSPPI